MPLPQRIAPMKAEMHSPTGLDRRVVMLPAWNGLAGLHVVCGNASEPRHWPKR